MAILFARSYQNYFVSMEAKYIDMELRIGDRDVSAALFLILVYNTNVSKVQIGNKEPVPGSLLTIIGFILVSVFFSISSTCNV